MLELSSARISYLHNSLLPPWPWCIRQVDLFILSSLGDDDDDDDDVQFLKHMIPVTWILNALEKKKTNLKIGGGF